jgi:malonyl-CoA decarboxylase
VALAEEILDKYAELTTGPRIAFFEALANRFGPDRARLDAAIAAWQAAPSDKTAAEIHAAAEARRQELLRRLNLAPGGTAALVRMRDQLIDASITATTLWQSMPISCICSRRGSTAASWCCAGSTGRRRR